MARYIILNYIITDRTPYRQPSKTGWIKNEVRRMKSDKYIGLGAAIGVAIGATYGSIQYQTGMGLSLSVAIGAALGVFFGAFLKSR